MPGDDELASAGLGPIFRSILKETAKKLPNKGSGDQILNTLKNTPGLKQQELKWTGLDDFLKGKKNVTKEEIQDYLKNNTLDVLLKLNYLDKLKQIQKLMIFIKI